MINKHLKTGLRFLPVVVLLVLAVLFWQDLRNNDSSRIPPSALIEKPFPEFKLPDLQDEDITITKANLLGKKWIANVWATWCPSCYVEHPFLLALKKDLVNIVGINYKDNRDEALLFLQSEGNPFMINIYDSEGMLPIDLGVTGAPESYFINKQGIIVHRHVGVINQKIWTTKLQPIYNSM